MRRGTTPTLKFRVRNDDGSPLDLTDQDVYVLVMKEQGRDYSVERSDIVPYLDGEDTVFEVTLTQEETLGFRNSGTVEIQLRSRKGDVASATGIAKVRVTRLIKGGVI